MAIDPVGPLQGGLEHINRYDYAYNNPYKYIDSTGLYPTCDCKDDKTYEGVNESMKGNLSRTEKKSGGFGDIIAHVPIYNNLEIMGKIRDKNLFTGLFDFIDQVKTNGNMDYKKDQTLVAIYGDRVQRFGNWHYGLMAHKMGLSLNTAVLGAAGYQLGFQTTTVDNFLEAGIIASQLSVPSGRQIDRMYSIFTESGLRRALESGRTFGDNPRDGIDIMKGWDALDEWK
ncbi:hypothetical protein WH50_25505 [Pokkaliibacter plantistimulans]|uniref:Bacterial toxin 44 domain-containing protein n=2 Tax=Pokkaliibacter plantistimulans TaxID=1635171 RepID=A0ABX5LQC8_9GAMM|nr:hypothetical protein WH50_25505 [Pokkaliibacter plantistimulans]